MIAEILVNPLLVFAVVLIVVELREHGSNYGKRQIFFNILMVLAIVAAVINLPESLYPAEKLAIARTIIIAIALLLGFGDLFHLPKETVVINVGEIALLSFALSLQASMLL
ncbi:MAG TPA: hypothetical protein PKI16_02015 [Candidatus Dojkabacteria bacterium]|nr:hypothetical protein [Candidatus Dojkabacteria bacterium]